MKDRFFKKDPFQKQAKKDGLVARSYYKLEQIDVKFDLVPKEGVVLDLGSAPGSWLQYHLKKMNAKGRVVAIDLNPLKIPADNRVTFLQKDLFQTLAQEFTQFYGKFGCVCSDIAPQTSGDRDRDHIKSYELCMKALDIACLTLEEQGSFVCKMYQGSESQNFSQLLKKHFSFCKIQRPEATRRQSKEIFFVGKGFRS
ncbi:MAG: RlmE family RNA methyltransferase [Bdellovibrionales bacterium]|nr:RlmE family RNA methyltransferase [Bdellovibrionales bacterium]